MAQTFSGMAIFTCLFLGSVSVQAVRVALVEVEPVWVFTGFSGAGVIFFGLLSLVRIFRVYGQGGARLEEGSPDAPLTGGLADNRRWLLGVIYVDREDPSLLVESRFGFGYTMNFGKPIVWLLNGVFLAGLLGLVMLAVTGNVY